MRCHYGANVVFVNIGVAHVLVHVLAERGLPLGHCNSNGRLDRSQRLTRREGFFRTKLLCSTQKGEGIAGHTRESVSLGQPPLFPGYPRVCLGIPRVSPGVCRGMPGHAGVALGMPGCPGIVCVACGRRLPLGIAGYPRHAGVCQGMPGCLQVCPGVHGHPR